MDELLSKRASKNKRRMNPEEDYSMIPSILNIRTKISNK